MGAFLADYDIQRTLCRGVGSVISERRKRRDPDHPIPSHCRWRLYLWHCVRDGARAFREYLGVGPAPLALHGGIITLSPFDVLSIFLFVHLAVKMEIRNSDRSSSKSELLAVTTVAPRLRAVSPIKNLYIRRRKRSVTMRDS